MADKSKKYGLAYKDTSFHDFETGFDLVRDQSKELGDKVGRETRRAIQQGRLVEVVTAPEKVPGDKDRR